MPRKKAVSTGKRRGRPPGIKSKTKVTEPFAVESVEKEVPRPETKPIEPRKVWPENDPYNRHIYNSCAWGVHHRLVESRQSGKVYCPDCYQQMY